MIPQSTVAQILETAVIEEVIGDYVELKKQGSSYRGLSPFTNEKTPSFYVIPNKGIFKDFSSGKGGSLITFLMELESLTYPEALRLLAKRYNIEIEEREQTPEELAARSEKESIAAVVAWAQKWFTEQLHGTEAGQAIGLSYFTERGFRPETLKRFLIGYSPDVWDAFSKAAVDAGYEPKWLVAAGLSRERDNGGLWDFFKGRVMFPIRDITGRVIGFGGRTLKKEKDVAKYFNSPESALYHKSDVLFGIHLAKPAITKEDRVLLVEGYTDVMALHQAGLEHAVASSGTALTEGQIKIIRRFTKRVTVLFDGDAAGVRASLRGIDLLLAAGLKVKVLLFPDGDDPDSYSRKVSASELKRFVDEESQDFVAFKIQALLADAGNDPLRRSEAVRSVVESIAAIPDAIERSVYLQASATQLAVSEELLQGEVNKAVLRQLEAKRKAEERAKRSAGTARTSGGRLSGARPPAPLPPRRDVPPMPPPPETGAPPIWDAPSAADGLAPPAPPPPDVEPGGLAIGPDGTLPGWSGPERPPGPPMDLEWPDEPAPSSGPSLLDVPRRYHLEKDLIRLLVNYGGLEVDVPIESEEGDEPATEAHPFAEWVIHSLEEERIHFEHASFQQVIDFAVACLDDHRIPEFTELLTAEDVDVQRVLADAMMVQHVVSENWALRHGIYPEVESDHLEKALLDAMHNLRLDNIQRRIREIGQELRVVEGREDEVEATRELLRERVGLDREKSELAKHFNTTILPL